MAFRGNSCVSYNANMTSEDQQLFRLTSSRLLLPQHIHTFTHFLPLKAGFCASVVEREGVLTEENENGTVRFLETCANCLSILYSCNTGRLLLIYSKTHTHTLTHTLSLLTVLLLFYSALLHF